MMPTAVLRLCGQLSGGPSGVVRQSKARMRAPISPPPAKTADSGGSFRACRSITTGASPTLSRLLVMAIAPACPAPSIPTPGLLPLFGSTDTRPGGGRFQGFVGSRPVFSPWRLSVHSAQIRTARARGRLRSRISQCREGAGGRCRRRPGRPRGDADCAEDPTKNGPGRSPPPPEHRGRSRANVLGAHGQPARRVPAGPPRRCCNISALL